MGQSPRQASGRLRPERLTERMQTEGAVKSAASSTSRASL